ncbi:MAG: serine/threonine-protein kinase [Euryarchaeota archaeon ADurb.BinA087]|nr:MAG: serine/threonine-protein kinase [Euryarchaeota archaeon ADurb.BinA087]
MKSTPALLLVLVIILTGLFIGTASAADYYVIIANAGSGGSIVPADEVLVAAGGTQIFTIIPDTSYEIADVVVNGVSIGARSVYTFYNVNSNHVISARFSPLTGALSISSDPAGASVYIDSQYVGRTKARDALIIDNIPVGTRTVELILKGYTPWSTQIMVNKGEVSAIPMVALTPITPPPTTIPTTTVPTTTIPTTTVPTTTIPTTTIPTTTIPTTTVPTTTIPTTTVPTTTIPTTTVPTTTIPTTTVPTTTIPTTTVPTTTIPTTTVPTTTVPTTTIPTTTVPTTTTTIQTTTSASPTKTTTTVPTTIPTTVPGTSSTSVATTTPSASPSPMTTLTTNTPGTSGEVTTVPSLNETNILMPNSDQTTDPVTIEINGTGRGNNTALSYFPTIPGKLNPFIVILLSGGLCLVPLITDTVIQPRPPVQFRTQRKMTTGLFYLGIVAGIIGAGFYTYHSGLLSNTIPPFISILLPVSAYLVISGLVLTVGTLLSRSLKYTISGHLLLSLMGVFIAALALIATKVEYRLPLLIIFSCALAGAVVSRRESRDLRAMPVAENPVLPTETIIAPRSPTIPTSFPKELLEKYSDPQLIGMGGVARVFKAINNQTGDEVALKIPVQFNETSGKSFMKEIKAWEDLSHENIVKIHEVNILPVPYVEMEYLGSSLADLQKPLAPGDAARIIRDIANGLSYAHSQGIIHRDIKPQNILMTEAGIPRITDWGMSKVMGTGMLPTITGFSLSYAAPEQITPGKFGDTDQRTDIYQLGVVFYELLTAELPFEGDDISRVSVRILNDTPPPPSDLNPAARLFDGIVAKCLEKDPADRYQSIKGLMDDIEQILVTQIDIERYEIFE